MTTALVTRAEAVKRGRIIRKKRLETLTNHLERVRKKETLKERTGTYRPGSPRKADKMSGKVDKKKKGLREDVWLGKLQGCKRGRLEDARGSCRRE